MQFQHARCDERRGSFHVVLVISNLLFRPIHHYNSPARGKLSWITGWHFYVPDKPGVAETYSRKRVYNCSYTDSKFGTFMSGIFTTVWYFTVRSLFFSASLSFSSPLFILFSFSSFPAAFSLAPFVSLSSTLFLIPHEHSVSPAYRSSPIENSYEVRVAVT